MSWARMDDKRALNPKLAAVGFEARGLDEAAICWASMHETDGSLTESDVRYLANVHRCRYWRRLVAALVAVGRWDIDGDGWVIHDFLEFNPSRADNQHKRDKRQAAGSLGGQRSAQAKAQANAGAPAQAKVQANGKHGATPRGSTPSRPVVSSKSSVVTKAPRDPRPVENLDDDDLVEKALNQIADLRIDRAGRANITNLPGYRRSVLASLRTELADRIATAPEYDTAEGLTAWLEPMSPAERQAAAQAEQRQRNDGPRCTNCEGHTRVETDQGAVPCPQCQPSAQTA